MLRLKYIALSKWIWSACFFLKNVFFKEDLCIIKKTEEDNRYAELDIEKIYVKYMCKNK